MLKTLRVHSLDLLRGLIPILVSVAFIEFAFSRTTGRLSHLFQGHPAFSAMYELGVLAVYGGNVIVLLSILLLAAVFIGSKSLMEKAYGLICVAMVPVALILFSFSLPMASLLVGFALFFIMRGRHVGGYGLMSALMLAASFITVSISVFSGQFAFLQTVGESLVILASIFLFLTVRGMGKLSWWRWTLSIAIPVTILILPHYLISVMPWTLRQVTTFAVNFRLLLPVEVYAAALFLFVASILRVAGRDKFLPYGLLLLILGGLPQWNVYPLLLTMLGSLLVILSLSGWLRPSLGEDLVGVENSDVLTQTGGTSVGVFTGAAYVTDQVPVGLVCSHFHWPKSPVNSVVPGDTRLQPINQRYQFKLGRGRVEKIGTTALRESVPFVPWNIA